MQDHWKIKLILATVLGAGFFSSAAPVDPATIADTHDALHRQGFKVDLADFRSSPPREMVERANVLTHGEGLTPGHPRSYIDDTDLMMPLGDNAAMVVWNQGKLPYADGFGMRMFFSGLDVVTDVWPAMRVLCAKDASRLDDATTAVLSGPYAFDLHLEKGPSARLTHLSVLKRLEGLLAGRAMLTLHDHDQNAAWTNLFAATRLVTAWRAEPTQISQLVRCDLLDTAYRMTWQAMQNTHWTESQLARLQQEWESLDLFTNAADAVALSAANDVETYRLQKMNQPLMGEDLEPALKQYGYDEQIQARYALSAKTWEEMRALPGVTNPLVFNPQGADARATAVMRMRMRRAPLNFAARGGGYFGRIAEAESRRRVLIAALAIERYYKRHGAEPDSLADMMPDFINTVPLDFIDGKPLRYAPWSDGHFLLYSIGLDCVDNGGKLPAAPVRQAERLRQARGGIELESDLVWPRPAPAGAVYAFMAEKRRHQEMERDEAVKQFTKEMTEMQSAWTKAARELLTNPKYQKAIWTFPTPDGQPNSDHGTNTPALPKPVTYKGPPLNKVLANTNRVGTHYPSLDEMLALKQVITGKEPEFVTYELSIGYDALTHTRGGELILNEDDLSGAPVWSGIGSLERATNGDCLLSWNTYFDNPGHHALRAFLVVPNGPGPSPQGPIVLAGPALPFNCTNLCQFFPDSAFDERGAFLGAGLAQSNGSYTIEIQTTNGAPLKTITGSTTNGLVNEAWDLIDSQGHAYTNDSFDGIYTVQLAGPSRSQTLKKEYNRLGYQR